MASRESAHSPPRLRLVRPGYHQTLRIPLGTGSEATSAPDAALEPIEADAAAALSQLDQQRRRAPRRVPQPLAADDPRWALAVQVSHRLEGDVLRPDHRTALNRIGKALGLNAFQCALVIAIVQDQARRGLSVQAAADSLAFVPLTTPTPRHGRMARVLVWTAVALAAEVVAVLIWLK